MMSGTGTSTATTAARTTTERTNDLDGSGLSEKFTSSLTSSFLLSSFLSLQSQQKQLLQQQEQEQQQQQQQDESQEIACVEERQGKETGESTSQLSSESSSPKSFQRQELTVDAVRDSCSNSQSSTCSNNMFNATLQEHWRGTTEQGNEYDSQQQNQRKYEADSFLHERKTTSPIIGETKQPSLFNSIDAILKGQEDDDGDDLELQGQDNADMDGRVDDEFMMAQSVASSGGVDPAITPQPILRAFTPPPFSSSNLTFSSKQKLSQQQPHSQQKLSWSQSVEDRYMESASQSAWKQTQPPPPPIDAHSSVGLTTPIGPAGLHLNQHRQSQQLFSQEFSQSTQNMTQTQQLTPTFGATTGDGNLTQTDLFSLSSPGFFQSQSPGSICGNNNSQLQSLPWGRLVPCAPFCSSNISLFPKSPGLSPAPADPGISKNGPDCHTRPYNIMGLVLRMGDSFNEYSLGRGSTCDIVVTKPATSTNDVSSNNDGMALVHEWALNTISQNHCRIYAKLEPEKQSIDFSSSQDESNNTTRLNYGSNCNYQIQIYVQDQSTHGTLINKNEILRRGQSRPLLSGDEICLVNPLNLRKKVKSSRKLQLILQYYSYSFVNLIVPPTPSTLITATSIKLGNLPSQQQPQKAEKKNIEQEPLSFHHLMPPPAPLPVFPAPNHRNNIVTHFGSTAKQRKPAVNVRATKQHRCVAPNSNNSNNAFSSPPPSFFRPPPPTSYFQQQQQQQPPKLKEQQNQDRLHGGGELQRPARRSIHDVYDIQPQILGTGTVGEVRRAIHRQTGQPVAVKIIKRYLGLGRLGGGAFGVCADPMSSAIQAEALILKELKHPYVVRLIDCFVTTTCVYLVMDLLEGGDLYYRIVQKGHFSEVDSRRVMRRLLSAIYYLHEERHTVHRDLKPENILLKSASSDIDIQLTDFGLAKVLQGADMMSCKTFCGTPLYLPPEIAQRRNTILGQGRYGKPADMWSLGVILYILLCGCPPFEVGPGLEENNNDMVSKGGGQGDFGRRNHNDDPFCIEFPDSDWGHVSDYAKDLVLRLLVLNPDDRWTVRQACEHAWILTDDGDTHCHPLQDPKVLATLAESEQNMKAELEKDNGENASMQKRLFAAATENLNKKEDMFFTVTTKTSKQPPESQVQGSADKCTNEQSSNGTTRMLPAAKSFDTLIPDKHLPTHGHTSVGDLIEAGVGLKESSTSQIEVANMKPENASGSKDEKHEVNIFEPTMQSEKVPERPLASGLHKRTVEPDDEETPTKSFPCDSETLATDSTNALDAPHETTPSPSSNKHASALVTRTGKNSNFGELMMPSALTMIPVVHSARRPLSPVSPNNILDDATAIKGKGFSRQLKKTVIPNQSCRTLDKKETESRTSKSNSRSIAVASTKVKSIHYPDPFKGLRKASNVGNSLDDLPMKTELSDDEILSQFSDQTESISSFDSPPSKADSLVHDGETFDHEENDTFNTVAVGKSSNKRKRRVTDTMAPTAVSGGKGSEKHVAKKVKTKASAAPNTSAEEKHKQTSLLSWFKAKKK